VAAIWGHAAPDRVATRNSGIGEPLAERISALTERRKEKCVGDRWKERPLRASEPQGGCKSNLFRGLLKTPRYENPARAAC